MPLIGKGAHLARLRNLTQAERIANKVVVVGADMIRAEAFRSISAGSVSGKNHVPSRPGEPPNRDIGGLQAHIETSNPEPGVAEVRSEAEYAAALEFGTSKMASRPYMRPARQDGTQDQSAVRERAERSCSVIEMTCKLYPQESRTCLLLIPSF